MLRILAGINSRPDTFGLVVANNRGSLLMIRSQSLLKSFCVIIASLDQGLAGDVVLHSFLWWVEDFMVRPSRGRVDKAAGDTRDQQTIVDLQLDSMLERLLLAFEHLVKPLGLRDGTWEAIEDEARLVSTK